MTSRSSSQVPPETFQEREREAVEGEIKKHERASLLGKLAGIGSIQRNLKSEDRAVKLDILNQERILAGKEPIVQDSAAEDDMGDVLAGGDVKIEHHHHPAKESPAAPQAGTAAGTIGKLLLGGAMAASGFGLWSLLKPAVEQIVPADVETILRGGSELKIGEPYVEEESE